MTKPKKKNLKQAQRDYQPLGKETESKLSLSAHIFLSPPYRKVFAAIVLVVLVVISYTPIHEAGFVWDDVVMTEARQLHSKNGLKQIWFEPRSLVNEIHYWPIVYTTFWIEYQLWELSPLGYHAVNIFLHALNTVLLFFLLHSLGLPGALLAAAIFGVHPVHVD